MPCDNFVVQGGTAKKRLITIHKEHHMLLAEYNEPVVSHCTAMHSMVCATPIETLLVQPSLGCGDVW